VAAKNKVIAGDYEGQNVSLVLGNLSIGERDFIPVNRDTVEAYELLGDEKRKSAASGVARGLVGGALLGPIGLLAGGMSAKSKGVYQVAVVFKDGKRSLLELDDKRYKALMKACF
jgi:hypothetical protein